VIALLALLIAFLATGVAPFAWYIYNTGAHTTSVHMAAGAGVSLQISDDYDGPYSSAAVLDAFVGTLNPVSTDNILNGFQKVTGFTNGKENQPQLVANLFARSTDSDYYQTSLFFRTNGNPQDVYLSGISYEDSNADAPISTAIRVGFVAHRPGRAQPADESKMWIFSISDASNPKKEYNTATGQEGYVLDSTVTDGTTVPFSAKNADNYCDYDSTTGVTTLKKDSLALCTVTGGADAGFGDSVQIDIYIWLEGCDEDCTINLCNTTLKNLALSFASFPAAEA
jgi:hypothetical protein